MNSTSPQTTTGSKDTSERNKGSAPAGALGAVVDPAPASAQAADFVTTVTNPAQGPDHRKLLDAALDAATKADRGDKKRKEHLRKEKERSTIAGREVVRSMLVFVESFMDDERKLNEHALNSFLKNNTKKVRNTTETKFYRLSKHCSVEETPTSMIAKRAYALEIIIDRGISSDELMEAFEEEEGVGPDGAGRSGVLKYVLIYENLHPSEKQRKAPSNKYEAFGEKKLLKEAPDFLSALLKLHLVPDEVVKDLMRSIEAKAQAPEEMQAP